MLATRSLGLMKDSDPIENVDWEVNAFAHKFAGSLCSVRYLSLTAELNACMYDAYLRAADAGARARCKCSVQVKRIRGYGSGRNSGDDAYTRVRMYEYVDLK